MYVLLASGVPVQLEKKANFKDSNYFFKMTCCISVGGGQGGGSPCPAASGLGVKPKLSFSFGFELGNSLQYERSTDT